MCHSPSIGQTVAKLRVVCKEMRRAADRTDGIARAVPGWADSVDTAIADLLEVERRARYAEVLAVCLALVDATADGPPAAPAVILEETSATAFAPSQ